MRHSSDALLISQTLVVSRNWCLVRILRCKAAWHHCIQERNISWKISAYHLFHL